MKIRIYAHRGYSSRFPENSRPAFEAAFQAGAHGVEADLQKCADGTFVILHDPTLERTTSLRGSVKDLTWEKVSQARLAQAPSEPLLKLDDLLALLPAGKLLNLELKAETIVASDLPAILSAILHTRGSKGTMISSFNHELLPTFRKAGFETGALLGEEHSARGIKRLMLDLIRIRPSHVNAPMQAFERLSPRRARTFFRALKLFGLRLAFWTVNREEEWRQVRPFADALISDEVEAALSWISS